MAKSRKTKQKCGLAMASKATRTRVAKLGGKAKKKTTKKKSSKRRK